MAAVELVELWRGGLLESVHRGHVAVCDGAGQVIQAWGDPEAVIFPRSSAKMIQALPLVESGAADAAGLTSEHLALACASHQGAPIHTDRVAAWLSHLGLAEPDLRCGAHMPSDRPTAESLVRAGDRPCQIHNNCSGKHAGFLTLARHLGAGPEYVEIDHPVQQAVRAAAEETAGEASPGWGVDGCSAPNFAGTLAGVARAMASYATAGSRGGVRADAQRRLTAAMIAHPELVAGERRACTDLMRACEGRAAIKTGAEGVFVAILPQQGLGVALKIADGATRASEAVIAALLVRLGVLDAAHPVAERLTAGVQRNWRGIETGRIVTRL
ncbi:asparaginase [Rubellimicrobium aerolatum]|uniref:Asparaginase n=1 Tax=Rubellimicrobium aerolatum TaxID=490979 RepID=A0ABW0SCQ3_9RHOB|nr:asparaginase [Rubellimicrobium aerolatum]MBP1806584.1 L-asparaginase II [Rubellimicrobium aerolatum]